MRYSQIQLISFLDKNNNDKIIPDISILFDSKKFTNKGYHGAPTLIVEVISPTSIQRDREVKFRKYEEYGVYIKLDEEDIGR